jgi:hypothetical protein
MILPGLNMNSKTASSEILLAAILDYKKRKEKYIKKKKRQGIAAYLLYITPVRKKKGIPDLSGRYSSLSIDCQQ